MGRCQGISSICFPETLTKIGRGAFGGCGLSGNLNLPSNLEIIESYAFSDNNFSGDLILPESLKELQYGAFLSAGEFYGTLDLGNITHLEEGCFSGCSFTGNLIIPEGTITIPKHCFSSNGFYAVTFPSSLREIGEGAFAANQMLYAPIILPEGVVTIGKNAFSNCGALQLIQLPSTLQSILNDAFNGDYGISQIICHAIEPPTVHDGAFDGVAKNNFTVQVPSESVQRYRSENGWSDFTAIGAYANFSANRRKIRTLNAGGVYNILIQAPALQGWDIESLPEWISVTPNEGTGKTPISISVQEMSRTNEEFELEEHNEYNYTYYSNHKGRTGDIVFRIPEKGYTYNITIEQFDSDDGDGDIHVLQTATQGLGIDLIFLGDGYDARDIKDGVFLSNVREATQYFFDIEPFRTYQNYFNVYAITCVSADSGIETVNTSKENIFGGEVLNIPRVIDRAQTAHAGVDLSKSIIVLLQNTASANGYTNVFLDSGATICVCPISEAAYPWDFRGVVQREVGGHGFGRFANEASIHDEFFQNCPCTCCSHDDISELQEIGFYRNISLSSSIHDAPWAHLAFHPSYADYVDLFEGAYMHSRGVYRSEAQSCMINSVPYFPAICRQVIVERIMELAEQDFSLESFYEHDSNSDLTRLNTLSTFFQPNIKNHGLNVYKDYNKTSINHEKEANNRY